MGSQHGFPSKNFEAMAKFFWDSLVRVTSPSEQLEVIRNFVNGLIISLKRGSASFHVSLSPDAPAQQDVKDVKDFTSTVTFVCHYRHNTV